MDPLMNSVVWPPPPSFFVSPPPISAPNHHQQLEPPYPDMIIEAITALKEREGSSRQAIDRYIQSVYTDRLTENHTNLLTANLKKMKAEGTIDMVKHSYALPGTVPDIVTSDADQKRGRGRPPKDKTPTQVGEETGPNAETMLVSLGLVDGPANGGGVKRGRGRPRLGETGVVKEVGEKKPRGRPPRMDRGAGRPLKVDEQQVVGGVGAGQGRRGRPPKKVALPGGKPRGRPRKFPVEGGVVGGASVVGLKMGRGRPPNAGGQLKKPRMYTGKPLGRPRKDAFAPANQVAAQHLVAYQDLANKLVHFQTRVKQAVDLVRPYFTSETTPYVYGALQELEELANMDLTAPPQPPPQAQPQPPPPPQAQLQPPPPPVPQS